MTLRIFLWFIILWLSTSQSLSALTVFDLLTVGSGVQTLGMGNAGIALSGDETLFNNPAGMGKIEGFRFTSLSARILDDINYTMLGVIQPLGGRTAVGLGLIASFIPGIETRDRRGNFLSRVNFENNLLIAGFGRQIDDQTCLGGRLKYYLVNATEISAGNGAGWNLDLGLVRDFGGISLGLVGKNLASSSRMNFENGEQEPLPASLTVGLAAYLCGRKINSLLFSPFDINAAADYTLNLNGQGAEPHIGLAFSPIDALTIRIGSNRGDFTSGASLVFYGIGFHLANWSSPAGSFSLFSLSFDERGWTIEQLPDTILARVRNYQ